MKRIINNEIWARLALTSLLGASACDVDETDSGGQGISRGEDGDETEDAATEETAATEAETTDEGAENGGVVEDGDAGSGDASTSDAGSEVAPESPRVRGFVVIHSDYSSSTISAIGLDGEVLSPLLLSSGSAPPGLSEALSSDIVLSNGVAGNDHTVIVDRGNHVINWLNLETAEVDAQLNVGPGGLAANPYDYVSYADDKAFVTRYASNSAAGEEPFDEGGDVLIIDPSKPEITGRIDLAGVLDDDALLPRPASAVLVSGRLYVMAAAIDVDFSQYGESKLVTIDAESEEIVDVLTIDGMRNCGELAVSPSGGLLAIGCVGDWTADPLEQGGIAVVDIDTDAPVLGDQYFADVLGGFQVNAVAFASEQTLLWTATGSYDDDFNVVAGDSLRSIDLAQGAPEEEAVLETRAPYNLGGLECVPSRGVCLLADAEAGSPQLIALDEEGGVEDVEAVEVDDGVGHPPRYVGTW